MSRIFVIEDQMHTEWLWEFPSFELAINKLEQLAKIPFDEVPNKCPCTSWIDCKRYYVIIEYDDAMIPWQEAETYAGMSITKEGVERYNYKAEYRIKL